MYSREEAVAIDAEASLSGSDSEQEGQQQEGQQRWGWTGSAKGEGGEAVEILELMRSVTGGFLRGDEERVLSNYAGVQASRRLGVFACVGAKRGGVCGCVCGGGGRLDCRRARWRARCKSLSPAAPRPPSPLASPNATPSQPPTLRPLPPPPPQHRCCSFGRCRLPMGFESPPLLLCAHVSMR